MKICHQHVLSLVVRVYKQIITSIPNYSLAGPHRCRVGFPHIDHSVTLDKVTSMQTRGVADKSAHKFEIALVQCTCMKQKKSMIKQRERSNISCVGDHTVTKMDTSSKAKLTEELSMKTRLQPCLITFTFINPNFIPDICHFFYTSKIFGEQNLHRKKRVNCAKIHRKLPIFCVITAKYTVNCQFFALNQ